MDADTQKLLTGAHASLCVQFGTTAPYALGAIRCERVGFADLPFVTISVMVAQRDMDALAPIARQHVYRYLAERDIAPEMVKFSPSVGGSYRRRRFCDQNESSPTCGKNKMGCPLEFRFEMDPLLARAVQWQGSRGTLPATWELQ